MSRNRTDVDPPIPLGNDPSGMERLIGGFPSQFEPVSAPRWLATGDSGRLWVAAMGGSAFAGDMLAGACSNEVCVVRGYELPVHARANESLLALSYSGDTAETLEVWRLAGLRGMNRAVVTSGGHLGAAAKDAGVPLVTLPSGLPPRAAAGFAWTAALAVVSGAADQTSRDIGRHLETSAKAWRRTAPLEENAAFRIAESIQDRPVIIYSGGGPRDAALLRWRTQLNENAKVLCHTAVLPEMNHNEVVGWTDPGDFGRAQVLMLVEGSEDPGTKRRIEVTHRWLESRGVSVLEVRAQGATLLQRIWWLCHLADYVSLYLAALRGVDPTPVTAIDELKRRLAEDPN